MLSDEEMKAIEKIRSFNQYNWEMNNLKEKEFAKPYFDALDTILNLIEKQSKEIEELNEALDEWINGERTSMFHIHKDKIKAKIEELDKEEKEVLKGTKGQDRYAIKQEYMHKRSGLQSLLEKE